MFVQPSDNGVHVLAGYTIGCITCDILAGTVIKETWYLMTKGRAFEAFSMLGSDTFVGTLAYCDSTDFRTKSFSPSG